MENRKAVFINFINNLSDGRLLGVYYLDKSLGINHYIVYNFSDLDILREKLKSFDDTLNNDLIKILYWCDSDSEDYLCGVYDGINSGDLKTDDGLLYSN